MPESEKINSFSFQPISPQPPFCLSVPGNRAEMDNPFKVDQIEALNSLFNLPKQNHNPNIFAYEKLSPKFI